MCWYIYGVVVVPALAIRNALDLMTDITSLSVRCTGHEGPVLLGCSMIGMWMSGYSGAGAIAIAI